MDRSVANRVILNARDPLDASSRIHFTARAILFLTSLFDNKLLDAIDLHTIILRIAYACGCFRNEEVKYVSMRDVVVYLNAFMPPCICPDDIIGVAESFDDDKDNTYSEVSDMKELVSQLFQD